jgi:site-specific DNA recombinase
MKTKAVIYCRVSSKEQEETGYSLDAQEKLLKEYADKKSYAVVKVYRISESASGKQIRKTFNEMLDYVDRNNIRFIICEKIDRLTRNLKDAATISDWIQDNEEHEVHFVKENFVVNKNTRAHENLVWDMKVAIARFYTNNLSEEVRKGQKEKISQGWLPSRASLGYKTIGEKGHKIHILDEKTAPLVRKMFEYATTGTYSLTALVEKMFAEGLRSINGKKVSKSRVEEMLKDPFYYGCIRWKGEVHTNGKHEPIVTKEIFQKVQDVLTRKKAPHYKSRDHIFKKMIKCGECGGNISGEIQKGHVYYSCKHYHPCTQKGMTKQGDVENKLFGVFKFFQAITPDEAEELKNKIKANHAQEIEYKETAIKSLNERYSSLQRRLDHLYDDRLDEKVSRDFWERKQKEITTEQAELLEQINKIKSEEAKYFEIWLNIIGLARRAEEIYKKRSPEERRLLLVHLFSLLTLKNKETGYTLKQPVAVLAKRVQQKIDAEIFEQQQKTAQTVSSSGNLRSSTNKSSSEPLEAENNFRTSEKPSVKARHKDSTLASRPLLPRQDSNLRPIA